MTLTRERLEARRALLQGLMRGMPPETQTELMTICDFALANLEGEDVWCVVAPSGYRESYHSTKENADYMANICGPGWTVTKYRLVPVKEG